MRVEMLVMAEHVGVRWTTLLLCTCMREGEIQVEWRTGLIVPVWKSKGDVHHPGKYRGITLLRNAHMKKKGRVVRGPGISEEFRVDVEARCYSLQ